MAQNDRIMNTQERDAQARGSWWPIAAMVAIAAVVGLVVVILWANAM